MHNDKGFFGYGQTTGVRVIAASHCTTAVRSCISVLALLLSGPILAAGFTCTQVTDSGVKSTSNELEEVVITGKKATANTKDLKTWLRRLVGHYSYEGEIDLCGNDNAGDKVPVTGRGNCVSSGSAPAVHCTVDVHWPEVMGENNMPVLGGVSYLMPGFISYGLETRQVPNPAQPAFPLNSQWGLMFTQVDSRGGVEWGSGVLVGNTFTSTEPCVGIGTPGTCQKSTRITAISENDDLSIRVAIAIDSRWVLRQTFLLRRDGSSQTNGLSREPSP